MEKEYARSKGSPDKKSHGHEHVQKHSEKEHMNDEMQEQSKDAPENDFDGYIKAGKILGEVLKETEEFVKPGIKLLDIALRVEQMIKEKGAAPAFPANLSLNSIAAHYTPTRDDTIVIKEGDILKVDLGAHVDGFVADAARTFCFNNDYLKLSEASKRALEEAIKLCKPGTNISELSETIEDTIVSYGYKPIQNLTGHGVGQYIVHMEPTIPNVKHKAGKKLEEGMVIAIEPFATDGAGIVKDTQPIQIYRLYGSAPVRSQEARKIIEMAFGDFVGLPFAERWVTDMSAFKVRLGLKELRDRGLLHEYAPLREQENGMVSQHEHTIIIKDEPVVTTVF